MSGSKKMVSTLAVSLCRQFVFRFSPSGSVALCHGMMKGELGGVGDPGKQTLW